MPKKKAYSDILALLDNLIDSAEDQDLSTLSKDPLAALRTRVETLTTALRVALLALSCHGQTEAFAQKVAVEIKQILELKKAWQAAEAEAEQTE